MGPREDPQVNITMYHYENALLLDVIVLLAKIQKKKQISNLGKPLILSTHDNRAWYNLLAWLMLHLSLITALLGAVHILRQPPKGGEGVRQMLTIADEG